VIGDDGDVDGQLMTVVIGAGGDSMHCTNTFVKCHWKISAYGFNRWIDRADDFGWQGSGFF
jgi:hypothetical protein